MRYLINTTIISAVLGIFAGQSLAFEELGKVKLAPADYMESLKPGTTAHWLNNGEEYSWTIHSLEKGIYTGESSDGCKWTVLESTWAPSLSWEDCGGSTGSQKITKSKGKPWPMKVKTKFSFNFTGQAGGSSWKGYRRCKVKSAVKVRVPAGEFDTYKLTCSVDWETKTFWYSPEIGISVAVQRKHKKDRSKNYLRELVKIERS